MSNYYEILGVWRDASREDIELAAQTMWEHWQAQLALNDPLASDWLQIIEQARVTLLDPEKRAAYDEQLVARAEEEKLIYSPGFPWRPYLCALLAVPALLAAFVTTLAVIANNEFLTDATSFKDALLKTMVVASAVAFPCGVIVLLLGARVRGAQRELRILQHREGVEPATMARLMAIGRLSEYADVAIWATWLSLTVLTGYWVWAAALLIFTGM